MTADDGHGRGRMKTGGGLTTTTRRSPRSRGERRERQWGWILDRGPWHMPRTRLALLESDVARYSGAIANGVLTGGGEHACGEAGTFDHCPVLRSRKQRNRARFEESGEKVNVALTRKLATGHFIGCNLSEGAGLREGHTRAWGMGWEKKTWLCAGGRVVSESFGVVEGAAEIGAVMGDL